MKYAIMFALVLGAATGGFFGGGYLVKSEFYAKSNVTWTQFTDGYDACEQEAQEKCAMYGGFAPRSQFE